MDSEHKEQRYLICPVCNKINPATERFCQFCWGAALNQDVSYSEDELEDVKKLIDGTLKRKKHIRFGILGAVAVAIVVLLILWVVNYTDALSKPDETLNSDSPQAEWTMFRHDLMRSGSAGDISLVPEGTLKWVYTAEDVIHSSPAVVDGTVYFGSQDYHLYAVDADNGDLEWKFKTGSRVDSSPAVADGMVFFGSNDSRLYAVDASDGTKIWEFKTKYPVRSSPAIADGTVYFGSDDYYLYAVDIETGKKRWRFDTDSPAGVSPVVDSGIVYYGSAGGLSYAVEAKSGQDRLQYQTAYTVYASPIVYDGVVYFTTTNGMVSAVDQMARTWLWEHWIRPRWAQLWAMLPWIPECPEQSGFLWTKSLKRASTTTPIIEDGIMYIGSGEFITALDLETREVIWEFETGDIVRSSPALAGSVIYTGSDDGNVYAIDKVTGEQLWSYNIGAKVKSSPAVVDGVIYIGADDGKLYAIE